MSEAGTWPEADLTRYAFLGGQLQVWQPRQGYRAGVDPVLLAASVPARAGDTVLELGCGAGVASLCLGRRIDGLHLTGLELQPAYADLARRNAAENRIGLQVMPGGNGPWARSRRWQTGFAPPRAAPRRRGTSPLSSGPTACLTCCKRRSATLAALRCCPSYPAAAGRHG